MAYPKLDNTLTYRLKYFESEILQDAQPIIINKDIERIDNKLLKKEEKRVEKLERKQLEKQSEEREAEQ